MRWGHRPTRQLERAEAVDPSSQMGGYRTRRCGFILLASAPPLPLPLASSTREPTNNRHFPLSTQFARAQPLLLAGRPGAPGCGRPVAWGTAVPAAFGGRPLPATGVVASGGDAERSWRGAERRAQLVAGAGASRRDAYWARPYLQALRSLSVAAPREKLCAALADTGSPLGRRVCRGLTALHTAVQGRWSWAASVLGSRSA